MNKNLAKILSVIAHPVFINLLCLYLLFVLYPPLNHGLPIRIQLFYISFIFISTSIIPIILVLVMRVTGNIKSIQLESPEERKVPYFLTMALYIFNYFNFVQSPSTNPLILHYLLACCSIVLVVMVINFFNKISIHLATLGALVGLIASVGFMGFVDIRLLLILAILLSGIIGVARLTLNAHLPQQVYSGFLVGFTLMFLIMNL